MKNKQLLPILTSAVLGFLLAFGGIGCLATAFDLEVSFAALACYCAVFAIAGCVVFSFRRGKIGVLCVLALLAIYLLRRTELKDQILHLAYRISRLYNAAYGCGWLGRPTGVESVAFALYLWGGLTTLIAGWCMSRGRLTAIAVFFSLLPLALCLVLTDTIPKVLYLFILLLGLILLLLTQSLRRQNAARAASLTWMLVIPVTLALGLLFITNPEATYSKQHYADKLGDSLLRAVDRLPYVEIDDNGYLRFNAVRHIPDYVDLQYKGPNSQFPIPVMEVTAEGSGPLYLRGRDYDCYTGTQWTASGERSETFTALHANSVNVYGVQPLAMGKLTVKTSVGRSSRYLPYYPDMNYHLQDGACNNPGSETAYSYDWYVLPEGFESAVGTRDHTPEGLDAGTAASSAFIGDDIPAYIVSVVRPYAEYLQLPEDTQNWAATYLAEHLPFPEDAGVCAIANAIADLVRCSAVYDLNTPRMPEERQDFARWFLEESDTGYCVHYATATTVLLRAAGIPARYVEGYLTTAVAGKTVTVTEKDAHAWAEYYVAGIGWIPLESTAGDISSDTPPVVPSTESTPPDDTTAATTVTEEPTDPSTGSTDPSETATDPTDTATGRPDPDTPHPSAPAPSQQTEKKPFTVGRPAVTTLCLLLLLLGQYPIRLRLREKHLHSGSPNSRAVKNWRFACRLAKLSHQPLPAELEELALRARFSQHTLTEEDLEPFEVFRTETVRLLRECPWWLKLYHRLVWAAY